MIREAHRSGDSFERRHGTAHRRDDFIQTASHELRSPLAIIKGVIDNLKDGVLGELNGRQMQSAEIASRHVDRMTRIIDNLLDMARLESGKTRLARGPLDAGIAIHTLAQDFQILARERGILLRVDLPEELPPVYADPDLFSQVIVNLLSNALKFGRHRISVRAAEVDRQKARAGLQESLLAEHVGIQFTVEDDGPGISQENIKHLFNKFVQFHRPADANGHKGTGLGLAISREIVELHQGKIWAESRPGRGARFHFVLPRYDEDAVTASWIRQALSDAGVSRSPLSLLALSVRNMEDLRRHVPEDSLSLLFRRFRDEVETGVLRKGDGIEYWPGRNAFLILVQSGIEGASSVRRRLRQPIQELACEGSAAPPPSFGIGVAIYPEHARRESELLRYALDHVEPMTVK